MKGREAVIDITFKRNGEDLFATLYGESDVGVILCPPHPLYGGNRFDMRLVFIAKELSSHDISALCLDYKHYTGGKEEVNDVLAAISYMGRKVKEIGLLGYSYGTGPASRAVFLSPIEIKGLVLLSPLKRINDMEIDLSSACKKLLICGKYDEFVAMREFEELYSEARGEKEKLILDTDHFYMGSGIISAVTKKVVEFFAGIFGKQ